MSEASPTLTRTSAHGEQDGRPNGAGAPDVRGLALAFGGARTLVDVSLEVGQGQIVALIGPNGAATSMLLEAIVGMLPFEWGAIDGGSVNLAGRRPVGLHPVEITQVGVALVQERREVFRELTVAENLRAASLLRPREARAAQALVFEYFPPLGGLRERLAATSRQASPRCSRSRR